MNRATRYLILGAFVAASCFTSARAQGLGGMLGKAKEAAPKGEKREPEKSKDSGRGAEAAPGEPLDFGLPPYYGPKKRLAVMDFEVKVTANSTTNPTSSGGFSTTTTVDFTPPTDFGTGLTEMLTTALMKTDRFILLERKNVGDVLAEQQLDASAAADPSSAAKPGRLLGAQVLVRGAITEYAYKKSSIGGTGSFGKLIGASHVEADAMVALDVRLYDAATGQILDSVRAEGHAKSSGTSAQLEVKDLKVGGSGFFTTPLGQASRKALERAVKFIVEKTEARPWEGAVAEVDGDGGPGSTLYINAGSAAGLKAGDELEVVRAGREIVDPQTRVTLGRTKDTPVGRLRVESVTEALSIARPVEGQGFQKADLVRLAARPAAP